MVRHRSARQLAVILVGLAALSTAAIADTPIKPVALIEPTEADARIARGVVRLLEGAHLNRLRVDEEMSKRLHRLFLDSWDAGKRYYMQTDIDEFARFETKHADTIKKASMSMPM